MAAVINQISSHAYINLASTNSCFLFFSFKWVIFILLLSISTLYDIEWDYTNRHQKQAYFYSIFISATFIFVSKNYFKTQFFTHGL